MMDEDRLTKLLPLPAAGRIELAQDSWSRVRPEDLPPLSEQQQAEIERRLDAYARDPGRAKPWCEVRVRLWSRRK